LTIKRLLTAATMLALLAVTASAFAQTWSQSTRPGSRYSSAATTGSCHVIRQPQLRTATVACGAAGGSAVVRYPFAMRSGCGPTVNPTVDFSGITPTVSAKFSDGTVGVAVHRSGQGKTVISLVSISYYCN
jgi:hypothetical protein